MLWKNKNNLVYLWLWQACYKPVQSFCLAQIKWLDGLPVGTYQTGYLRAHFACALIAHDWNLQQDEADIMLAS